MSRLLTPLTLEEIAGTRFVRLAEPFVYQSDVLKKTVKVPKGFICDLESIARWPLVYWILGRSSDEAGVIHDYLYRKNSIPVVSRRLADAIYNEASKIDKCDRIRSWMKWLGVRVGGRSAYHRINVEDYPPDMPKPGKEPVQLI